MIFGVLPQKKNQYALRILGNCGEFTSEELLRLSELTAKFGNGKITATSRGTFELNGVSESELEPAIEAVQAAKLRLGGTGATVRAVVACKGTDCRKGMFDVHAFACRLDKEFYGIDVPKKSVSLDVLIALVRLWHRILGLCPLLQNQENLKYILVDC